MRLTESQLRKLIKEELDSRFSPLHSLLQTLESAQDALTKASDLATRTPELSAHVQKINDLQDEVAVVIDVIDQEVEPDW